MKLNINHLVVVFHQFLFCRNDNGMENLTTMPANNSIPEWKQNVLLLQGYYCQTKPIYSQLSILSVLERDCYVGFAVCKWRFGGDISLPPIIIEISYIKNFLQSEWFLLFSDQEIRSYSPVCVGDGSTIWIDFAFLFSLIIRDSEWSIPLNNRLIIN